VGNLVNYFVGVEEENIEDIWKLIAISLPFTVLPLTFIWLLPKKEEVQKVQSVLEYMEQAAENGKGEDDPTQSLDMKLASLDTEVAKRMGLIKREDEENEAEKGISGADQLPIEIEADPKLSFFRKPMAKLRSFSFRP